MEEKHFYHLKSNHNISIITRYVDNILIIYNHNKHIEEQIAQDLETIHKNIEFTYETETNNIIKYLDLTLKKNFETNSIDIEIYRKPSSNTIAIHRTSDILTNKNSAYSIAQYTDLQTSPSQQIATTRN
jgi:hypothetical protein